MFYLSLVQKKIISAALIVIFAISIYLLIKWFLKLKKKSKKNEMLTLNMVVSYKKMLEYIAYQIREKENFCLFLVNIENFELLKNKLKDSQISSYLKKIAKNLSIELPYGGKLAQTRKRDTFLILAPNLQVTEESYGEILKEEASIKIVKNDIVIQKNINISYYKNEDTEISKMLQKLELGLIKSKRNLGQVSKYEDADIISVDEFRNTIEAFKKMKISILNYEVYKIIFNQVEELYSEILIDDTSFLNTLKRINSKDHAWINLYLIEYMLSIFLENKVKAKLSIPVTLKTLEEENFVDNLKQQLDRNNLSFEQVIISIKEYEVTDEQNIIKNLLYLNNLGLKISYDVSKITPALYQIIQSYHVNRLEISENEVLENSDIVSELLYFAKVNHLEILVKNSDNNVMKYKDYNVTHVTKKTKVLEKVETTRKRGSR